MLLSDITQHKNDFILYIFKIIPDNYGGGVSLHLLLNIRLEVNFENLSADKFNQAQEYQKERRKVTV